ncbi:MAG: energy transducer TonB [Ginsengibacter sp.]
MNSNSILNSNLLDIIFENRNKDYGAYVLRRDYNKRLMASLMAVFAIVIMFTVWQMRKSMPVLNINPFSEIPEKSILPPPQFEKKKEIIKPRGSSIKHQETLDKKASIVKYLEEKVEPQNDQLLVSNNTDNTDGLSFETHTTDEPFTVSEESKDPAKPSVTGIDKEVPVNSPEILPQFPGGINELIKFLRRNLNTPQQLEEDEVISVKVKFIVNYNGSLMGFEVVETGGAAFDNEVLRVLMKMPKWLPGKSKGENVSAYFIVPVKFMVSD